MKWHQKLMIVMYVLNIFKETCGYCNMCVCNYMDNLINCTHMNLSSLPKDDLFEEVKVLNLGNNNFGTIPKGISDFELLEVLTLNDNNVINIDMVNEAIMINLHELNLSSNRLINWSSMKQLSYFMPNIKKLDLSNNLLNNVSELDLRSNSLTTLKLINCSIQAVSGEFLKGFPNLTELDLSYNRLEVIYKFPPLTKLNVLNLKRNLISFISHDAFVQLINLDRLILNENQKLRILNVTANNLKVLEAASCSIEYINLSEVINLTKLLLNRNSLYHVPFMRLVNLTYLDLSGNKITMIDRNEFRMLESLKYLFLSYNTINNVYYDTFSTNFRLMTLDLSNNYIKELARFISESLLTLNVSNCEIVTLKSDCLTRMPYLEKLILAENRLSKLPDNLNSDLKTLDLTSCRIVSLNNSTFASMKNLRTLYLTGNRLSSDIHPSYFYNVMEIHLGDNAWRCDCNSKSFRQLYDWLQARKSDGLTCQFPEYLEGQSWIRACYNEWYQENDKNNVLMYCITVSVSLLVLLCILLTIKQTNRVREQRQSDLEERRREETERVARERREYERRQAFRNAPDPREAERPPTYTEALLMPKLTESTATLAGSRHSINGSRKSLNSTSSRRDVDKRLRRKRRRRSRTTEQCSSRENIDTDTDSQADNVIVVPRVHAFKESSI